MKTDKYTKREMDRIYNAYGRRIKDLEKLEKYKFERIRRLGIEFDFYKEQPLPKEIKKPKIKGYSYNEETHLYEVKFIFNEKEYKLGSYIFPEIAHKIYLIEIARLKAFDEMEKTGYKKP